jgi:hypothetical protein
MSDYGSKCCEGCTCGMDEPKGSDKPAMLKQLKELLGNSNKTGMAERQLAIDQLIYKIAELED